MHVCKINSKHFSTDFNANNNLTLLHASAYLLAHLVFVIIKYLDLLRLRIAHQIESDNEYWQKSFGPIFVHLHS